jgi:transposase InsO family protein
MKWIEVVPTRREIDKVIISFLEENILSRFGCLEVIITDNIASFKSTNMVKLCEDYGLKLRHSTAYYPQGNGLVESSNKMMVKIIKKLLEDNNILGTHHHVDLIFSKKLPKIQEFSCFSHYLWEHIQADGRLFLKSERGFSQ